MSNALAADELLVEVDVPVPSGPAAFLKLGRKHANTPAVVTVAARVEWREGRVAEARIALGAAGPHPIRAREAERLLLGTGMEPGAISAASDAAAEGCEPFTDALATDWYRRRMVRVFVGRALAQMTPGATGEGR